MRCTGDVNGRTIGFEQDRGWSPASAQGGRSFPSRPRTIHRRYPLAENARRRVRPQSRRPCAADGGSHPRAPAAVGLYRPGPHQCPGHQGGLSPPRVSGIGTAAARHRQDPPRRRTDRHVRRRHPRGSGRYRGAGHRRVRGAAGDRRHAQGPGTGQRAGARHRQTKHLSRGRLRWRHRSGGQDRTCEGHARAAHRAPGHVADRVPRLRGAMGHRDSAS